MLVQEVTRLIAPYFELIQKGALTDSILLGDTKITVTASGLLSLCEAKKQTLADALSIKAAALQKEVDAFEIKPDYTDWEASQIPENIKTFKLFDWPLCVWESENNAFAIKQKNNWFKNIPDSYFATSERQAQERQAYNNLVRSYHSMCKDWLLISSLCRALSAKDNEGNPIVPASKTLEIPIKTLALLG